MTLLAKLIGALSIPLNLLNALAGVIAVVWLLIGGDWPTVLKGGALVLASSILVGILMFPGAAISAATVAIGTRTDAKGVVFFGVALLGNLYTVVIITVWCVGVLTFLTYLGRAAHLLSSTPYLLASYAVALAPWQRMAAMENGPGLQGFGTFLILFFAQLAFAIMMFLLWLTSSSILDAAVAFFAVMVVGLILQVRLALLAQHEGLT